VVKGLPAVDYSARDIIYRPRNVRAHRVYGFSPVQQVLMTVNIALRRQLWQLDYFTEGSIPDALIGVPQSWTPDQIRQFQDCPLPNPPPHAGEGRVGAQATSPSAAAPSSCPVKAPAAYIRPRSPSTRTSSTSGSPASSASPFEHDPEKACPRT
jgi:phage portal protein BeeE